MSDRRPVIAGNWKMFHDVASAARLAREVTQRCDRARDREVVVCPAAPLIPAVAKVLDGSCVRLGGQDLSPEPEGAFTGDVSARMLLSLGCTHVIIGHSERREHHMETDELVQRKVARAVESGLTPIVCVGERLAERDAGETLHRVAVQIREALRTLSPAQAGRVIVAYEPVWAIGTGRTATAAQAEEVHEFIRGVVAGMFGQGISSGIRILYGGSVKPDNIAGLMAERDVDGALVGGASLKGDSFAAIVNY